MEKDERERIVIRKTKPIPSKEQKAGFALVAVTGVLAIVLGSLFMVRHVSSPFDFEYVGPRFLSAAEERAIELEEQKVSDTDEDTLTDYDELYIYRTSPYLRDTDGDGIDDATEIALGSDPNCIRDECGQGIGNVYEAPKDTFDNLPEEPDIDFDALTKPIKVEEDTSSLEGMTPDQVRELLLQNNATEEQLSQLTDEQIMELYESALRDIEAQSGAVE